MTLRLGILRCDSVRPEFQPEFGDYPDMFRALLSTGEVQPRFRTFDLTTGEFPESVYDCDAWLFTGSKWSVYDREAWIERAHDLVRTLHEARRPTIGICFGHQLIARALGGRVDKAEAGWGVGVHRARILQQEPWMRPARDALSLLVSHQDQVCELPPDAQRLAGHEFCPNDMFRIGDHVLTFQGHPEFRPGYSRALMDLRRELLGESTYREGVASLDSPLDAGVAAAWIHAFIERAQPAAAG